MTCAGWPSKDTAYRRPLPGTKLSVGAAIASTSTLPVSNKYIWYSRHGASCGGSMLAAVTGKTLIAESVRP